MLSSPTFWMVLILCLVALFFLPTIIALIRAIEDLSRVIWLKALALVSHLRLGRRDGLCLLQHERAAPKPPRQPRYPSVPVPRAYDPGSLGARPLSR